MEYGIIGLLILIADIYAIIKTFQSAATTGVKLIWTLVILVFPLIGVIVWFIAGPKGGGRVSV
jgi:hypothetical protein